MRLISIRKIKFATLVFLSLGFGNGEEGLKDVFKNDFYIGVAINRKQADGTDKKAQQLITQQFNCISPENDLKWGTVHPQKGIYNFKPADDYVAFGLKNNMFIVGHNLVWHEQTPGWVFIDDKGEQLSRDALIKVMEEHITAVVSRYKGKIKGWDVVNEAFNDNGTFRKSKWHEIIGDDFIELAFEFAHKADPAAQLYYNDYNLYLPKKREAVIRLIKRLQTKSIPIAAIGEQAHYSLKSPLVSDVEATVIALSQAGVKVNFSELDINVLPDKNKRITADVSNTAAFDAKYNPYAAGLPDSVMQKLADRYKDLFTMFHNHRDKITRVTFWGLTDGDSWLNNWPVHGRTNYPLLFDRNYKKKEVVFDAVTSTVSH